MYLHLGKGTVIDEREIIGIFDLDITSQSHITRQYLNLSERSGIVINAAEDIPKSFVVCAGGGELSTISYTRWCRPDEEVEPMYMPGRFLTASSPSST